MSNTNDVTGDRITSKIRGKENYDNNYDRIFGKKPDGKFRQTVPDGQIPCGVKNK